MRRREFISLLGGAAATWPLAARAQQPAMPVVGFLNGTSPDPSLQRAAAFRQGLADVGFIDRQNVATVFRWAEFQEFQLPKLAADLVRQQVTVIAATGSTATALAAKRATSTIPIVFEIGGDPITAGLVDKLEQPGGNLTGVSLNAAALGQYQLNLVRELMPKAATIAVFVNPANPNSGTQIRIEAAARALGMRTSSSMSARKAASTSRLRGWSSSMPTRLWSATIRSSSNGAARSSRWRSAMRCPPSIHRAPLWRPAD